jgi:hypothetical protein
MIYCLDHVLRDEEDLRFSGICARWCWRCVLGNLQQRTDLNAIRGVPGFGSTGGAFGQNTGGFGAAQPATSGFGATNTGGGTTSFAVPGGIFFVVVVVKRAIIDVMLCVARRNFFNHFHDWIMVWENDLLTE